MQNETLSLEDNCLMVHRILAAMYLGIRVEYDGEFILTTFDLKVDHIPKALVDLYIDGDDSDMRSNYTLEHGVAKYTNYVIGDYGPITLALDEIDVLLLSVNHAKLDDTYNAVYGSNQSII